MESMPACICQPCRRNKRVRDDERRLGMPAPQLPPPVGVSWEQRLSLTVARMRWLYYEAGWTQDAIARHLNDHDLRTPWLLRPWSQGTVSYWMRYGPIKPSRAA